MELEFSRQVFEKYSQYFMKIHRVVAEFYADGRTDMTQLIVAFRNYATAPKKKYFFLAEDWTCHGVGN